MAEPIINGNALEKLAKAGLAGICIALVILVAFVINGVFTHIADSVEVMTELKGAIQNNTNATDRLERSLELNNSRGTTLILKDSSLK